MGYLPVLEVEKLTIKKNGRGLHFSEDDENIISIPFQVSSNLRIEDANTWLRVTIYTEKSKEVGYIPVFKISGNSQ